MTNEPNDTDRDDAPGEESATDDTRTAFDVAYGGSSELVTDDEGEARLALFGNLKRKPVSFSGRVRNPLRLREALAAMHTIVGSDYRYVPKDRTAYLAHRRLRQQTAGMSAWQAQQEYFSWLARNDPMAFLILDPVVTVHPDRLLFEVFSKDEGTYANLAIDPDAFEPAGDPTYGTTNIDFGEGLFDSVQRMRSHRETTLAIGQRAVEVRTDGDPPVVEKRINVPDSWIRGFLQVQSAATLPRETFRLAPMDLYNVLRHLRMHADERRKRRGLRVELVPGEAPRLVLEPWETLIPATAGPFEGRRARVVRIWGRRRLMLLRRLLPFVRDVEVHVLGSGLPSFWVLRGDDFTLTLGLTGFTAANWSAATSFDLLLPRSTQSSSELEKVVKHLAKKWCDDEAGIAKGTKLKGPALVAALQLGCQQGQLMFDLAHDVYRLRPLTDEPLDLGRLEYRNDREKRAHDLVARKGAVTIVSENRIHGTGIELTGKVVVAEDKREYRPQLLLADDGRVLKAECTCPFHRKHGLKHGPAATLIALRLAHARLEMERRSSEKERNRIVTETRTFSRRRPTGEEIVQIALDRQRVRIRWGRADADLRTQQLHYSTIDDARDDYLKRLDDLTSRGYLDATA